MDWLRSRHRPRPGHPLLEFGRFLFAAFIAVLGKQWLNRFAQVEISGPIADQSRNRVRNLDGMVIWHFNLVMECLPLMFQISLLLLRFFLFDYLFSINRTVAGVLIGFTAFGLFYLLIVSAATLSYTYPFQTPLSLILHFMIPFDDEQRRSRKLLGHMLSSTRKLKNLRPRSPSSSNAADENIADDLTGLATIGLADQPRPSFNKGIWHGQVLASAFIIRLFGTSTDADVTLTITKFIPEVVWHAGIRTIPLEKLYATVLE